MSWIYWDFHPKQYLLDCKNLFGRIYHLCHCKVCWLFTKTLLQSHWLLFKYIQFLKSSYQYFLQWNWQPRWFFHLPNVSPFPSVILFLPGLLQQGGGWEEVEVQAEVLWDLKKFDPSNEIFIDVLYLLGAWVNIFLIFPTDLSICNQAYHLYLGNFAMSKHVYWRSAVGLP